MAALLVLLAATSGGPEAHADVLLAQRGDSLVWEDIAVSQHRDIRRQGSDEIVSTRRELEVSSELVFVTTRGPTEGVPELFFTDLALWRLHAAVTPVSRLRLTAAATFLAKQPATLDEPFWQSAELGARYAPVSWGALGLDTAFGKLTENLGYHGSASLGFQARTLMNDAIIWEGRAGGMATVLWPTEATDTSFWFAEVGASGEIQVCWNWCREHFGATWLGIDLAVPMYHHPGSLSTADPVPIDPRTRLGLTVGSFFNVNKTWDFYATLSWIDRGDPAVPSTELPILDGGFDQVQIAFGLIAHWWIEAKPGVVPPAPR